MRTLEKFLAASSAMMLFLQAQAAFTPVDLTSYADPSQPKNQGDNTISAWAQSAVTGYNLTHNPDLPSPVGSQVFRVNSGATAPVGWPTFGANTSTIQLPGGFYNYVVLHWGGPQGAASDFVYYIGGAGKNQPLTFTGPAQYGLSSYETFTPVPEPSTWLAGIGALGLLITAIRSRGREVVGD